ncbi:MAG: pantoate--beta-alanine ligase [Candidatus Melainabacteria bacterium]|nr:pantoate--beta-alanine ligase [Candidatus Melainabacteria bacterium]
MTTLIKSINDIKNVLAKSDRSVGLVPTMGALHAGHISLIKACRNDCKTAIAYIFVNPLQFGPNEDFKKYPRHLENDFKVCEEHEIDFVFAPDEKEIYPENINCETITPPPDLANILCGKTRANHFSGVATVIKRFLNIIQPDYVYFGEKDLQQLYIIRWLTKEFKISTFVRACPIIRESNGLACSSRNVYLTEEEKEIASNLYKSLGLAKKNIRSGIFTIKKAILESLIFLSQFPKIKMEYFEARDKENLDDVDDTKTKGFYFLLAAKIGSVRLIDNIEL